MKLPFACPACGAAGSVDEAFVGRVLRCKPCQHRFAIPARVETTVSESYLLDNLVPSPGRAGPLDEDRGSSFVAARGEETSKFAPAGRKIGDRPRSTARRSRPEASEIPWGRWLIGVGAVVATVLVGIALFAPSGTIIVGSTLLFAGMAMVLVGFAAGAYGAFSEDFLYGFFYLIIPLYTAYYLVTRWEDLWRWCVCSTAGVGCVIAGTEILRRAGVGD